MNASGWVNWGEVVGRLKASCVDVIALRELLRAFLLFEKRDANQLMVGVGGQAVVPVKRGWCRGRGTGGAEEAAFGRRRWGARDKAGSSATTAARLHAMADSDGGRQQKM